MAQSLSVEEFEKLVKGALPFTPTSDQHTAIGKICKFIYDKDERSVFVLKGYAGTGKTNLISAFTRVLPYIKWRSVLLAPTGRAAKVVGNYSKKESYTIHKKIFKKQTGENGNIIFSLAENLHRNTVFIVDEASMISTDSAGEQGFFNSLLEDLFEYVYSGHNCKLILVGDTAQLPPVNCSESPALDLNYLKSAFHLNIGSTELKEVARQQHESGILMNATSLRILLHEKEFVFPKLHCAADVVNLNGEELEEALNSAVSRYGEGNVMIITRSNKRAGQFNQNYRNRVKLFEDEISAGDRLMVVKNNYFWLPEKGNDSGFIANGEMVEITRIDKKERMYDFDFVDCFVRFCDNDSLPEQKVKLITACLFSDNPSMSQEEQRKLYHDISEDVANEPNKSIRINYVRKSPYFNALQVKFSYAITCHKAQGGQWPVIFIDQGFLKEENIDRNFVRWLYTALTRASEQVYLINFNQMFIS